MNILSSVLIAVLASAGSDSSFVNYEINPVRPLALSPSGDRLAVSNPSLHTVEIYSVAGDSPSHLMSVPIGLVPSAVAFSSNRELWVVNNVSDSVNIVDLELRSVTATLACPNEPRDIVFAGSPKMAYVVCSEPSMIVAFSAEDRSKPSIKIPLRMNAARAIRSNSDGTELYVTALLSGNKTSIIAGDYAERFHVKVPLVVNHPDGPHGGQNPPHNSANGFSPPLDPKLPLPPKTDLIIKESDDGRWLDDVNGDWTEFVSGARAHESGRKIGWKLLDHDLAIHNLDDGSTRYIGGLMNACMNVAVNPKSGEVLVVGTDAINHVRYEPNLNGIFVRVFSALVDPALDKAPSIYDLNSPHIDSYQKRSIPATMRRRSIGDPRGLAWARDGGSAYVVGLGSNNLVALDRDGRRKTMRPIEVGSGPCGIIVDDMRDRIFIYNRFSSDISTVEISAWKETSRIAVPDATPPLVARGRKHFYNTHSTSGLGHVSCASCHIDAEFDGLAWDLGDPLGEMKSVESRNQFLLLAPDERPDERANYHPMKGPRTTQSLRGAVGHEPLHWSGDRDGIESFNAAYTNLQSADSRLTDSEMAELKVFLASLVHSPNPFRGPDNELPMRLDLSKVGESEGGTSQWASPVRGFEIFKRTCIACHASPDGMGLTMNLSGDNQVTELPRGTNGENTHSILISEQFAVEQTAMRIPPLSTIYRRQNFTLENRESLGGFGLCHSGAIPRLQEIMQVLIDGDEQTPQEIRDLIATVYSLPGADTGFEPPEELVGLKLPTSNANSHAAVGIQKTVSGLAHVRDAMESMTSIVDNEESRVALIVSGLQLPNSQVTRWRYDSRRHRFTGHGVSPSPTVGVEEILELVRENSPVTLLIVDSRDHVFQEDSEATTATHTARSTEPIHPVTAGYASPNY